MLVIVAVLVGLLPTVPAIIYFFHQRHNSPSEATRTLVYGLNGFNVLLGLMATGLVLSGKLPLLPKSVKRLKNLQQMVRRIIPIGEPR